MRIFIAFLLSLSSLGLAGQYQSLVESKNTWFDNVISIWLGTANYTYEVGDSIMLNGKLRASIMSIDSLGQILDTAVLIKENPLRPAITFYLQYEPSLQSLHGDSITLDLGLAPGDSAAYLCNGVIPGSGSNAYFLDSVNTFVDLGGSSRPHYHFHVNTSFGTNYFDWIEGIGPSHGGLFRFLPIDCFFDVPVSDLSCVADSLGNLIYRDPQYTNCSPVGLSEEVLLSLEVYPNPVQAVLNIEGITGRAEIIILDMMGKIVYSTQGVSGDLNKLNLEFLNSGIYQIIVQAEKHVFSARISKS